MLLTKSRERALRLRSVSQLGTKDLFPSGQSPWPGDDQPIPVQCHGCCGISTGNLWQRQLETLYGG